MINKAFIDQLFKSGSEMLGGNGSNDAARNSKTSISDILKGRGGAAIAGGAVGYLLGSKKGRKLGGKVLTYGGLAALGVLAYKAYGNWQQNNQQQGSQHTPQTLDQLPPAEAEIHGRAILIAVIGAAKADGHIDNRERELIDAEVAKLTADQSIVQWVDRELQKPVDPAGIARHASTQEMAAEMYLASVLVIDEESFMERSYLAELAVQLKLPESLQQELKAQAREAEKLING